MGEGETDSFDEHILNQVYADNSNEAKLRTKQRDGTGTVLKQVLTSQVYLVNPTILKKRLPLILYTIPTVMVY